MNNGWPWLSLCLLWPLIGAALLPWMVRWQACRIWVLLVTVLEIGLTQGVLYGFDPSDAGWQFQQQSEWIGSLHIYFQLAVDGVSVWLLSGTAWLTFMVTMASWRHPAARSWGYWVCILMLEAATVGVLTATDLVLFFFCWELTLPPIALLIARWGIGPQRTFAATQYTLLMLFGGVALLAAIALLALNHAQAHQGQLSFSLPELLATPIDPVLQQCLLALLLLAFAVKAPLPPFHQWLPTVALQAPPVLTALLMGMKLGLYGLLRLLLPLLPDAVLAYRGPLAVWGVVTLLYAALLALRQNNLRSLLAYASVSHVGLVVLALLSLNLQGWQGASMQLLNFTWVASALMLMAGMLEQRFGSNEWLHLGGLARVMPRFSFLFFIFVFASLGVPGSSSLVAELLMLLGIAQTYPLLAGIVLLVGILAAAYLLTYVRQAFWGPVRYPALQLTEDLQSNEWAALLPALFMLLLLGCWPGVLLSYQTPALERWLALIQALMTETIRQAY